MLRQRILNSSKIHFLKKSLKWDSRKYFHISHSSYLRKASFKRDREIKSEPEEPNVAGKFVPQPLKASFNNFYGIESDEGVIHISRKPTSHQSGLIEELNNKRLAEKFKRTRFGKMRFDNENTLSLHGQFEEGTYESDLIELSGTPASRNFIIEKVGSASNHKGKVSKSNEDLSMERQRKVINDLSKADVSSNLHETEPQNVSFIDELYFPNELLHNQNCNTPIDSVTVEKDTNFVENPYIPKEISRENINMNAINRTFDCKNDMNDNSLDNFTSSKSQNQEVKTSFIDESYFPNEFAGDERAKLHIPKYDSSITNFIEESCFGNTTENLNKCSSSMSLESYDELHENKSFDFPKHTNTEVYENNVSKVKNQQFKKEAPQQLNVVSVSHDESKENHNRQASSKKESVSKKDSNFEFFKNTRTNITNHKSEYFATSHINKMSDDYSIAVNSTKTSFLHKNALEKSSLKKRFEIDHKRNLIQKQQGGDKNIESQPQQHKISEKINKNEVNNKSSSQEDQPVTAFDFVKNLRGDKQADYKETISGFKTPPKEKLDSKGFRILKYQVPELKYFTRDEMLDLLVKNVLYSDDDVVVLNKPYNLVMHESKTTKDACLSKYLDDFAGLLDKKSEKPKLVTVHRLDKETTGCLLLARNDASAQKLKNLFAQRKIVKTYWIVTIRVPDPLQGAIDIPISEGSIGEKSRMVLHPDLPKDIAYKNHSKRGKNAVTHYSVVSESGNSALVEAKPETGIKHQIRVHFGLGLGCPILGDHKYSYTDKFVPQKLPTDMLQRLHVRQSKVRHIPVHIYARSIFIPQYTAERNLFVVAPMPLHMSQNLQKLKFKKQ